jgi:hypothetical protein
LSQGELHVVQPKRALDQRISGLRMILIAISRVCGPVAKSASSSRQPLVLMCLHRFAR